MKCKGLLFGLFCLLIVDCSLSFAECYAKFSWLPNTDTIDGYRIYHSEVEGSYSDLGYEGDGVLDENLRLNATVSFFTHNKTYYVVARAFNSTEESLNSNVAVYYCPAGGDGVPAIPAIQIMSLRN